MYKLHTLFSKEKSPCMTVIRSNLNNLLDSLDIFVHALHISFNQRFPWRIFFFLVCYVNLSHEMQHCFKRVHIFENKSKHMNMVCNMWCDVICWVRVHICNLKIHSILKHQYMTKMYYVHLLSGFFLVRKSTKNNREKTAKRYSNAIGCKEKLYRTEFFRYCVNIESQSH